jgi:hypothetical protein
MNILIILKWKTFQLLHCKKATQNHKGNFDQIFQKIHKVEKWMQMRVKTKKKKKNLGKNAWSIYDKEA